MPENVTPINKDVQLRSRSLAEDGHEGVATFEITVRDGLIHARLKNEIDAPQAHVTATMVQLLAEMLLETSEESTL